MSQDESPRGSVFPGIEGTSPGAAPPTEPVGAGGASLIPVLLSSPAKAYERLAGDPKWIGNVLVIALLFLLATWIQMTQILVYSEDMALAALEKFDAPAEAVEETLAQLPDPDNPSTGVIVQQLLSALIPVVFGFLVGGTLLHVIARIAGATPRWGLSVSVFALTYVVSAIGYLVKAFVVKASDTMEVTLGPGALLSGLDFQSIPAILLDLFDVFSIVALVLLAIGARVAFRVSAGTGWGIALAYWITKSVVVFATRAGVAWMSGAL